MSFSDVLKHLNRTECLKIFCVYGGSRQSTFFHAHICIQLITQLTCLGNYIALTFICVHQNVSVCPPMAIAM